MAINADVLKSIVSITQFNKGQASKIFDRVRTERQLVVLKNNTPTAVILSTEEFERMCGIEENYQSLLLEQESIANHDKLSTILSRQSSLLASPMLISKKKKMSKSNEL